MAKTSFVPAITFSDGWLHRVFGDFAVHVRAWPDPEAKKFAKNQAIAFIVPPLWVGLRRCDPDQPLNRQPEVLRQLADTPSIWTKFCQTVPDEIRAALDGTAESHFSMLLFVARHPGALDMLTDNPAIAVILRSRLAFHRAAKGEQPQPTEGLLRLKRRHILRYFGFPPTESAVNILRKVTPLAATENALLAIRNLMADEGVLKRLQRLPRVSTEVIAVLSDPHLRERVSDRFLMDLARPETESPDRPDVAQGLVAIMRQTCQAHAVLRPAQDLPQFHSVSRLHRTWDDLFRLSRRLAEDEYAAMELPAPPLPGTDTIVPLPTARMIVEEGRELHTCLFEFIPEIARGRGYYAYRILAPERATLLLSKKRCWRIHDLRGPNNREVARETRQAIEDWLRLGRDAGNTG